MFCTYSNAACVLKQPGSVACPVEHRFAPNQNHHPSDDHHNDTELEGVAPTVVVGGVEQGRRFAIEGQHIDVLDEQCHWECKAHHRIAKPLGHANGDGYKYQRTHSLRLEDKTAEKHQTSEDDVEHHKGGVLRDTQCIKARIHSQRGQVGSIESRAQRISTGREEHQVPRNVHIVPFHNANTRHQSQHSTEASTRCGIHRVESLAILATCGKDGKVNPYVLVTAKEIGVKEIYKMGGAQAVAALAFGTETVPKVEKITGPGNIFVTLAKKAVYGHCDIDMLAGPSEILIIADETADPTYLAADLLSQAEHDPLASAILVTDSEAVANAVAEEIEVQLAQLPRQEIAATALANYGKIILASDMATVIEMANISAPEHLEVMTKAPFEILPYIRNAGAIFLGQYSPEPLGDYYAVPPVGKMWLGPA